METENIVGSRLKKKMNRKNIAKFTEKNKEKMRKMFEDGYAVQFISRKFCCRGYSVWNNVFDLDIPKKLSLKKETAVLKSARISITAVREIRKRLRKNPLISSVKIANEYGIGEYAALSIIKGRTFRWVGGWTRPCFKKQLVKLNPLEFKEKRKTDLKPGPLKGYKQKVKSGVIKAIANAFGVSSSTICRNRKKYGLDG